MVRIWIYRKAERDRYLAVTSTENNDFCWGAHFSSLYELEQYLTYLLTNGKSLEVRVDKDTANPELLREMLEKLPLDKTVNL